MNRRPHFLLSMFSGSASAAGQKGANCGRIKLVEKWNAAVQSSGLGISPQASFSPDPGVWGLLSLEAGAELGQVWTSKGFDILPDLRTQICSAFVQPFSGPSSSPA